MPGIARFRHLSSPAILLLIAMGFCWKLVLTDQYTWLEGPDLANQVLPWYQFQAGEWHRWSFPLWDPYQWAGQPLLGQAQPGAAFPLNWLLFSLPLRHGWLRQPLLHWYFLVIHFLGSLFAYWLCRDLGRRRSTSILAGCVFAYGGFLGTNDWPQMLNGAIWAPLVLLYLLRSVRGDRPVASACLSGACLGLAWLSGHHQIPIFLSLTTMAVWIYYAVRDRRVIRLIGVFGIMTFLVGALQTLPAYEYGKLSYRWVGLEDPIPWNVKVPYSIHSQFSTTPETLLGIIFPGMHHHADAFMGVLAVAFAVLALTSWFSNPMVKLFGAIAGGGLLFTLGSNTLVHGVFYALVPVVDKARSPTMAVFIVNFGMSVLTAYGIDSLRDRRSPVWTRRIALSLTGIWAVVFAVVSVCALVGRPLVESRPLMTALFAVLGAGLIYGYLKDHISSRAFVLVAGLLLFCELSLTFGFGLPNRYEKDRNPYLNRMPDLSEVVAFLRTRPRPMRVDVDDKLVTYNAGDFYGFEQMGGYLASVSSNLIGMETHTERSQQLFAVSYFIGKERKFPSQELLFEGAKGLKVFFSPAALPRAWTVHKLQRVRANGEVAGFISNPANNLRKVASLTGDLPALEECEGDDLDEVVSHRANSVRITVKNQCKGMVVLADTYFPGWKATVDGNSVRVYEAYGVLRGVVVDKGSHVVEYQYRPMSVVVGATLTALGFVCALFCLTRRVNHS